MQYDAPPVQTTSLPPHNSHMTAPGFHWLQQPVAQPYDSHVAEVDYNQALGHSTPVSEQMYKCWPCSQAICTPSFFMHTYFISTVRHSKAPKILPIHAERPPLSS